MTKKLATSLTVVLSVILIAASTVAQTTNRIRNSTNNVERELIELERQMSEALAKQDGSVLHRLWSENLVFTSPNGQISNKSKRLAMQQPAPAPNQMTNRNEDVRVQLYGNTAVVIVRSVWEGKTATGPFSDPYQATHVWVKQQGRWQLVAAHVSQVKG
jgi:ketosteroid isomerase-like protein